MNHINSQTLSEVPTLILGSQSSLLDKDSQISAIALATLDDPPSLKRSLSPSSDLSTKRIRTVPTQDSSDEEIIAYLKLDTWRCEKNRELAVSSLISCFKEQRGYLVLPDLGSCQLPNCLEKMSWISSLEIKSTRHLGNFSVLTKLRNLKILCLVGETKDLSFLKLMPFIQGLAIVYNPSLKNLSFLKNHSNLVELYLDHNPNLKDLSEVKVLKNLKTLSLSGKFRDLSFLEALPFLQKLSVSSNPALKNASFLKYIPDLVELFLKNNTNLKNLSGIEPLIKLRRIDLSDTPIRNRSALNDLPALEFLISNAWPLGVRVEKSDLGLLRANIEDESLQRVNLRPFINSHKSIASWLKRLTNADRDIPMQAWDKLKTRIALSWHVLEILKFAQQDPAFTKDILLPLVDSSMTSCTDRTIYYLNEIIRLLELYKTKDLPAHEALLSLEKYYRLFLVKELARESAERRNVLHEEIEVQLDFFQKLDVELPFLNTEYSHLYSALPEEIESAESELSQKLENPTEWIRYLCLDPFWQQRLFTENPDLKVEFDRIEESKYEELEVILANTPNHPSPLKELEIRYKEKIVTTLGAKALQFFESRTH